jgi:hypothetical protein
MLKLISKFDCPVFSFVSRSFFRPRSYSALQGSQNVRFETAHGREQYSLLLKHIAPAFFPCSVSPKAHSLNRGMKDGFAHYPLHGDCKGEVLEYSLSSAPTGSRILHHSRRF